MLAVFMAACMAGIVAAAMPVATFSRTKAENGDKATAIAQKEIESIRGLGYANLTAASLDSNGLIDSPTLSAGGTYAFTNVDSAQKDSPGTTLSSGTGTVRIEQVDIELRRVTVQVSWLERGRTRTYALSTLVANL